MPSHYMVFPNQSCSLSCPGRRLHDSGIGKCISCRCVSLHFFLLLSDDLNSSSLLLHTIFVGYSLSPLVLGYISLSVGRGHLPVLPSLACSSCRRLQHIWVAAWVPPPVSSDLQPSFASSVKWDDSCLMATSPVLFIQFWHSLWISLSLLSRRTRTMFYLPSCL